MKKLLSILLCATAIAAAMGCEKAEIQPTGTNAILPLAVGNSWTYLDTMILSTTISGTDTIIDETTYRITETTYIDTWEHVNGKRELKRLRGYKLDNDIPGADDAALFPLGDTVWIDGWYPFYNFGTAFCPGIRISLDEIPTTKLCYSAQLMPAIAFPRQVGSPISVVPAFHSPGRCFEEFGNVAGMPLSYQVNVQPLLYEAGQVTVTTPAGTFNCEDFGSQQWAEGIGMVQSLQSGVTAFITEDGTAATGEINIKRVLKAYHLE